MSDTNRCTKGFRCSYQKLSSKYFSNGNVLSFGGIDFYKNINIPIVPSITYPAAEKISIIDLESTYHMIVFRIAHKR